MLTYLRPIKKALQLIWRGTRNWTIAYFVLLLLQALLPLAILLLIKAIVDAFTAGEEGGVDIQNIFLYIGLLGGVWLLNSILQSLAGFVSETQQHLFVDYMSGVLQKKSLHIDLGYYENPNYFDTYHKAQEEASYRPVQVLNDLFSFVQNGLSLASIAGLLVFLHWGIALLLLAASLPSVLIKLKFSRRLFEWQRRRVSLERRSWYTGYLMSSYEHAKEIRLFNYGGYLIERFQTLRRLLFSEKNRILRRRMVADQGGKAIEIAVLIGAYAFVAWRTFLGAISLGSLVMYFQAFQRGQSHLQQALQSLAALYQHRLFLTFLIDLLELEPQVQDPPDPRPLPAQLQDGVRIDGVSFQYPFTDREVLHDVSLEMKPGEIIALVGQNGSGKTTLLKLLCRFYDPSGGSIALDGIDLRDCRQADIHRKLGVIFQDFAKYHFTAAENIRIGDLDRPEDPELLADATRRSGADEFLHKLPQGYDNILGRYFDGGVELSGGQWQKVALARAFYRDAEIVILDEPTSDIDPLAEYDIFARFRELARDKIVILVTHRLYNLKVADRIIVMDEGRVAEQGSHEELMSREGLYFKMFEKQLV
jgi:ATP-binding cassette, subfamily B, bacterial